MPAHLVRLFGMCVSSDIPLPGLEPAAEAADPDVVVKLGDVPPPIEPALEISVDETGATLTIAGVARYRVSNGLSIVVEPEPGAAEANIRLFLLGSAMGLLLHQRGLLPLHASAVEIDRRAVAFIGPSGAGKSTLAAAFHDAGHRVIADDVCVVGFDDLGQAFALPGIPRLRLWEETLAAMGRPTAGYELSYAGDENFRKFDVPLAPDVDQCEEMPIAAVLNLQVGEALQFRSITGAVAAEAIFANTYRGEYLGRVGDPAIHWHAAIRLIRSVPLLELSRPLGLGGLADQIGSIVELVGKSTQRRGEAR